MFDLEKFMRLAGRVEIEDLDFEKAARIGITDNEARILRYMADTETHTILYLRDLLAGHSARDPEICSFLSVWVYEELWHGRAIDMMLEACGHSKPEGHYEKIESSNTWREPVEAFLSSGAAWITPRFAASHMAWGAINELSAAAAYNALARHTPNDQLAILLQRIAKQERKHFSFYYHQAQKRLEGDKWAQRLCWVTLKSFWEVVGVGVGEGHRDTLAFVAASLHADDEGWADLVEADQTIAQLPGLEWFDLLTVKVGRLIEEHHQRHGPVVHPQLSQPRAA